MANSIGIASDHAGFELKEQIKAFLSEQNIDVRDFGTHSLDRVDYPDMVPALKDALLQKTIEQGILICGSGIGISIAANRFKGVRAALCTSLEMAQLARSHNDANVLVLGSRITPLDDALAITRIFLNTIFEGGRHQQRIDKLDC